ncbi:hypothetical protein FrEUN1fDRAFT_6340, partial [Parafrankia sp. EUN1f]
HGRPGARPAPAQVPAAAPTRTITGEVAPLLEITGDEPRLRQSVGNLVRNALVHTPAGTPVEVEAVLTSRATGAGAQGTGTPLC